jgi:hypothetical protein
MSNSDRFASRLLSGEHVLWSAKPRQGIMFSGRDAFLIPFSLLWGGFAIFWEFGAVSGTMTARGGPSVVGFFPIWGVPFVLIGLYLIVGRFFVDAWLRGRMDYALTERRVLILRGQEITAVDLARVSTVNLRGGANGGRGTIFFGYDDSGFGGWGGGWGYRRGWGYWTPSADRRPQFIRIQRAQEVFNQIEAIRAKLSTGGAT